MPCASFAENIFHGSCVALTRSGTIGVQVWIYRDDNLSSRERTEWQKRRK